MRDGHRRRRAGPRQRRTAPLPERVGRERHFGMRIVRIADPLQQPDVDLAVGVLRKPRRQLARVRQKAAASRCAYRRVAFSAAVINQAIARSWSRASS